MEKFTSLSNIELMYIDGGFNAKGVWHKFTKRSNHAGIVFIRDFLTIIFIKKCIIKVWQIIAILLCTGDQL